MNLNLFRPLRGTSYIDLPPVLRRKHAVVNVRNLDTSCFAWSLVSALYPPTGDPSNTSSYPHYSEVFNFEGIDFPVKITDIPALEIRLNISVNVYGVELMFRNKKKTFQIVGPLHHTKLKRAQHVNLLLISNDSGTFHYCFIKNLSRLVATQFNSRHATKYFCDGCLQYFATEIKLARHTQHDCKHISVNLPTTDLKINRLGNLVPENVLQFQDFEKQMKVPFVCYADFESVLRVLNENEFDINPNSSYTVRTHLHDPFSFAYYIKCSFNDSLSKFEMYRGPDCAKVFIDKLEADVKHIYKNYLKPVKPLIPLNNIQAREYEESNICHICTEIISDVSQKVRDHSHVTGYYTGPAHSKCNLNYKIPSFFPVFFHNLSNYDSHLFIRSLALNGEKIDVLANSKEKYISFSKYLCVDESFENNKRKKHFLKLRFLDSFRFLPASLEKLTKSLSPEQFVEIKRYFPDCRKFNLIKQKGVFPYSYVNDIEKLNESSLPSHNDFYDVLRSENVSEDDYKRAVEVWNLFECKTLGDYSDLYLKSDVLILSDVFEAFRFLCLDKYKLDAAHFITSPQLSFSAMLRLTKTKFQLLSDIDMLHFFRKSIKGGVASCITRQSIANNPFLDTYDASKANSYILYVDATNLYGYSMQQHLPVGGFTWLNENEINDLDINNISDTSDIGYVLEVDLVYPTELHNLHNELPFCPENIVPPHSKLPKLIPNLYDKSKYVIHYRNLKQCLNNGLQLSKIHRVLKFTQSPCLKKYVDFNTEMRNSANTSFEKDFFKLLINAIFGKTCENLDKRLDIKLLSHWETVGNKIGAETYVCKPNFKNVTVFSENLVAVQMSPLKVFYNKPIYIGFSVLEIAKTVIYDFYYNYIKQKYGENVNLLYTDTDSLIMEIRTENVFEDIKENLNYFDTSNFDESNIHGIPKNKSVIGKMKIEYPLNIIREFYGTGAKAYCIILNEDKIIKKAKGVTKSTVSKQLNPSDYRDIVTNNCTHKFCEMYIFRSHLHNMYTELKNKVALSSSDDKRFLINFKETLAWGHYKINSKC